MLNKKIDKMLDDLKKSLENYYHVNNISEFVAFILMDIDLSNHFLQKYEIIDDNKINLLVEKIVTDFYAYNLYRQEINETLDNNTETILLEINELQTADDILNYVHNNFKKFIAIVEGYYDFNDRSQKFKDKTIANVINGHLEMVFEDLYSDFFDVDYHYEKYIKDDNIILGLNMIKNCPPNDVNSQSSFFKIEFENDIDRNHFLSYMLSNVYAYLKINGSSNDFEKNLVKLTEKIDFRMKCFYEDESFVSEMYNIYYNMYKDTNWTNFKDIRDNLDISNVDIIYKLDCKYKHPQDIMKNTDYAYTLMEQINEYYMFMLDDLRDQNFSDEEIVEYFKNFLSGEIPINFERCIFSPEDKEYFIYLSKLLFISQFYEYANYTEDELDYGEEQILEYLDTCTTREALELFDNNNDSEIILNKVIDYLFILDEVDVMVREKAVDDNKFETIMNINPFMYLEYRRVFGSLLPGETSRSTECGNLLISTLVDIVYNNEKINCDEEINYQDIARLFVNNMKNLYLSTKEMLDFILSNIYENLINKKDLNIDEKSYIELIEDEDFSIEEYLDDEEIIGALLFYFMNVNNNGYFDDKKIQKLRNNTKRLGKVKVLERLDPFYDIDKPIFEKGY